MLSKNNLFVKEKLLLYFIHEIKAKETFTKGIREALQRLKTRKKNIY